MSEEEAAEEEDYEYPVYFVDCTCDHEPDEHTWGECAVEGCDCEGGYEE